ncbi:MULTISPECIES: flagellar assembly protein FliW [Helicobacter]|uniref:Flagellar assembly factor FliW n=2 Tax=Helicobacter TaxID=209 RepID=A0A377J2I5_9HELI|nr:MULTISPECIES: flagellar assembly protein FliW [Helicobacter]MDL0079157.1 flagellar assembly protein FliW [Helicobacter sp. CPD2-1]MDL0081185.1 flagellar assembly protein FliW [Helicobacter sp. XJK30-2]STO96691.1 flagellar assembly protein FliW [Helicobacter canis]
MIYQIKAPILGFEHITSIELTRLDEHFAKITSQDKSLEMMLVNPYSLREYSFTIPRYIEMLLGLDRDSSVLVYCIVILQRDVEESMVNFLAPLIFNTKDKVAGQVALSMMDYPDFGFKDTLKSFLQKGA